MFFNNEIKAKKILENVQRQEQEAIELFKLEYWNGNVDNCIKQLGVLEYLKVKDIEFFSGLTAFLTDDYDKALQLFAKIPTISEYYTDTLYAILLIYCNTGDYLNLNNILLKNEIEMTPIKELEFRLTCISKMNCRYYKENLDKISELNVNAVTTKDYFQLDPIAFFNVCRLFVSGLVVTGELINKIAIYKKQNRKDPLLSIDNPDISRYICEYEKWCFLLRQSKHLHVINFQTENVDLSMYALSSYSWPEKIEIFVKSNIVNQIKQIILTLCRPENHTNVEPFIAVECILEAYHKIDPGTLVQVVNHYFDIIQDYYAKTNKPISGYVEYVYSEIIATGEDPYNLKQRLDSLSKTINYDNLNDMAADIKITRGMSENGHRALLNAEATFKSLEKQINDTKDFSSLSLQFFRIIEIEYVEKLLKPLLEKINIKKLFTLAKTSESKEKVDLWTRDCKFINSVLRGQKTSIPIGAIRTILEHMVDEDTKDDPCAVYLNSKIDCILTEKGKEALHNKTIIRLISEDILDEFRTPGAHPGFNPYSVSCKSREYVLKQLPIIITWFK